MLDTLTLEPRLSSPPAVAWQSHLLVPAGAGQGRDAAGAPACRARTVRRPPGGHRSVGGIWCGSHPKAYSQPRKGEIGHDLKKNRRVTYSRRDRSSGVGRVAVSGFVVCGSNPGPGPRQRCCGLDGRFAGPVCSKASGYGRLSPQRSCTRWGRWRGYRTAHGCPVPRGLGELRQHLEAVLQGGCRRLEPRQSSTRSPLGNPRRVQRRRSTQL